MQYIQKITEVVGGMLADLPIGQEGVYIVTGLLAIGAGLYLLRKVKTIVCWLLMLAGLYALLNGLVDIPTILAWRPI